MATSDGNLRPLSPHRKRQAIAWIVFLLIVFGLGGYKVWQNRRDAQAQADWQARSKRLSAEAQTKFGLLRDHARKLLGKPNSQHQLEMDWNGGAPFENQRERNRNVVEWTDPKYGSSFNLEFEAGVLTGWNASWAAGLARLNPQPYRFSAFGKAEAWRRNIAIQAPLVWFALFIGWWFSKRHRWLLSQLLLALVLVCCTANLVNPNYGLSLLSITSNDQLGISIVMLFVTVELLVAMFVANKSTARSFFPIRFGLRRLLGAMTVIACLLAMGVAGYFLLFLCIVSLALFVATYEFARIQAHARS